MILRQKQIGMDMLRAFFHLCVVSGIVLLLSACDNLEENTASEAGAGTVPSASIPAPVAPVVSQNLPTLSGTGIVWKPVSEGNGALVILIPSNYSNVGAAVLSESDELIEQGNYVGRTNGSRPTYRFTRPGRDYPKPSHLRIGSTIYNIPSPASRYN